MPKDVAPTIEEIDITPANYRFPGSYATAYRDQYDYVPPLGQRKRANGPSISLEGISSSQSYELFEGKHWRSLDGERPE